MYFNSSKSEPVFRTLQSEYVDQVEDLIISRLQEQAKTPRAREEMIRDTGIDDATLLDEFSKLGVTTSTLITLRLLPLILVAWAEKRVDRQEVAAVLKAASEAGIRQDSEAYLLLDHWLRKRPPDESLEAWKHYMGWMMSQMNTEAVVEHVKLLEKQLTRVAKSSGGHLGFGSISPRERKVIDTLIRFLRTPTDNPS